MKRLIDRRAALGALASLTALAIPAAAMVAPADPIFAAIEKHRVALAAFVATLNPVDEVLAELEGREVTQAAEDAYDVASEAQDVALDEFVQTAPHTIAGMRAMLEYVVSEAEDVEFRPEDSLEIMWTLLRSPLFT
jgi:hypothetical protein